MWDGKSTPGRSRTCDLCLRRAALYPAELLVPDMIRPPGRFTRRIRRPGHPGQDGKIYNLALTPATRRAGIMSRAVQFQLHCGLIAGVLLSFRSSLTPLLAAYRAAGILDRVFLGAGASGSSWHHIALFFRFLRLIAVPPTVIRTPVWGRFRVPPPPTGLSRLREEEEPPRPSPE